MCLIIFSWKQNTEYPLVLMANRDEFYQRPTLQASVWKNQPEIVAGKDLQGNGTWMGISKSGKWAALTNYRALSEMRKDAPTRGSLVTDFLVNNYSPEEYLTIVKNDPNNYNGFNLLVGNANGIGYYSNKEGIVKKVETGPTIKPIKIKGRIAGIFSRQAVHCAKIPKITIPPISDIIFFLTR